jgi:hypothetical protein
MSEELRWNVSVQVVSGPTVAATGIVRADAYSKTQVVIPPRAGTTDGTIDVSVDTTGAELLVVKASQYVDSADPTIILQYDINDAGAAKNLSAPLVLIGGDAIKLLADPVTKITFTNPIEASITADIVVGGDATP